MFIFVLQSAFRRCGTVGTLSLSRSTWNVKVSSYNLRSLLWAGGATASNKVSACSTIFNMIC